MSTLTISSLRRRAVLARIQVGLQGAQGPAGPAGAQGPAGPAGAQGPAGSGGIQWGAYAPGGVAQVSNGAGFVWPGGILKSGGGVAVGHQTWLVPFVIQQACTLTGTMAFVWPSGADGVTIRKGIYAANGRWEITGLHADLGTISAATTGNKFISGLNVAMPAGRYYAAVDASGSSSLYVQDLPSGGVGPDTQNGVATANSNGGAAFPNSPSGFAHSPYWAREGGGGLFAPFYMNLVVPA